MRGCVCVFERRKHNINFVGEYQWRWAREYPKETGMMLGGGLVVIVL